MNERQQFNFDEVIDRTNTNCEKYDARERIFGTKDLIPLWVADTDFKAPPFIVKAIKDRAEHEIFGYPVKPESYYKSIQNWLFQQHRWNIEKEWISFSPNVVIGLASVVLSMTEPGDKIIVQPPVYFPFFHVVEGNGRIMTENQLILKEGRYYFDFDDLKNKIDDKTKMLLLCNPHNPGGRVWEKDELAELARICIEKDILVVSDEIHSDLIFSGSQHIPFATLSDEAAQLCVTASSASKTFNIAGLSSAYLIVSNEKLRSKLKRFFHISEGNLFGLVATEAAYSHGKEWLTQLLDYIERNYQFLEEFLRDNIPALKPMKPDGTYLAWIDFSGLPFSPDEAYTKMVDAGVGLSPGYLFGTGGNNFMRLNMGCPLSVLEEGLIRMKKALSE